MIKLKHHKGFWILLILLANGWIDLSFGEQSSHEPAQLIHVTIWDVNNNRFISPDDFTKSLAESRYVLLGELHDNALHHHIQASILNGLVRLGRRPAVVFEMLKVDDNARIAEAQQRYPHDPDRIAQAVDWEQSGWPQWHYYRPIFKQAMDAELPVVAGNLAGDTASVIAHKGFNGIDQDTVKKLNLNKPLESHPWLLLTQRIQDSHGGMLPDHVVHNMANAQQARDAQMAKAMSSGHNGDGAVLIAGYEHTRHDFGVPYYLKRQQPLAPVLSVTIAENHHSVDVSKAHSYGGKASTLPYDYVVLTSNIAGNKEMLVAYE